MGAEGDDDEACTLQGTLWERLDLRCAVTWQRLHDPAKLVGCAHAAKVNFNALRISGTNQGERANVCPVAGCNATMRIRNIVRDVLLQKKLKRLREDVETVWLCGEKMVTKLPRASVRARME